MGDKDVDFKYLKDQLYREQSKNLLSISAQAVDRNCECKLLKDIFELNLIVYWQLELSNNVTVSVKR